MSANADYLKKLLVSKLETGDEESAQFISDLVDAVNGQGGVPNMTDEAAKKMQQLFVVKMGTGDEDSAEFFSDLVETMTGGGANITEIIDGSFSGYAEFPNVKSVRQEMFKSYAITGVSLANCEKINPNAFGMCSSLSEVYAPKLKGLELTGFASCWSLKKVYAPELSYASTNAFAYCSSLTSADFPKLQSASSRAFMSCWSLKDTNLPMLSDIQQSAFLCCSSIEEIDLPKATYVGQNAFQECINLKTVKLGGGLPSDVSGCRFYNGNQFQKCYNLLSVYLLAPMVYSATMTNIFASTPISGYTASTSGVEGNIYVPASLYSAYISASGWSAYASRFVSIPEE